MSTILFARAIEIARSNSIRDGDSFDRCDEGKARNERLFHADSLNGFALHFHFDSERRPQVRSLHDQSAYPDISR